jgi:hypothetical protein
LCSIASLYFMDILCLIDRHRSSSRFFNSYPLFAPLYPLCREMLHTPQSVCRQDACSPFQALEKQGKRAQRDVMPFVKDPSVLAIWSRDFFRDVVNRIKPV